MTADFSATEQAALFHDNAARLYRFDRSVIGALTPGPTAAAGRG